MSLFALTQVDECFVLKVSVIHNYTKIYHTLHYCILFMSTSVECEQVGKINTQFDECFVLKGLVLHNYTSTAPLDSSIILRSIIPLFSITNLFSKNAGNCSLAKTSDNKIVVRI